MRINNNISALNAWRGLTNTDNALGKSLEKLSSGLRINRAGDDAAGLAISEKMRGQIRGLNMAVKNAQDGISLIQTAEGALTESHAILQRMRELAVQASNDTNTLADRKELQKELNELTKELDRIANATQFNTRDLLKGGFGTKEADGATDKANPTPLMLQIGANSGQAMEIYIESMNITALGSGAGYSGDVDIDAETRIKDLQMTDAALAAFDEDDIDTATLQGLLSHESADAAIVVIDAAIQKISGERSKLGAFQNRLEHTIKNLGVAVENLQAAESRIRDVDMAAEMMNFTKQNILMQAGTAMLAQANARPQSVLQLLG